MKLVIAEKPSVARDIARVLRCTEKHEGYFASKEYMVSWALGHLVTLKEPQEIDQKYKKWNMTDLPILPEHIPCKVIPKTKSQFMVLKKLFSEKTVDSIICATDAGREGELIFRLIYNMIESKKPVERLWISSLTDQSIREGFEGLKPISEYDGLYASALARQNADWLVGMNASRAYSIAYHSLLSIGRVQTPTLALLVKRLKEIREFVPEEFFTVTADFGVYSGKWFDEKQEDERLSFRIGSKEEADTIVKECKGKIGIVRDIKSEEKREIPPLLYDLTSLQRDANRMLGFTASKTLSVAQSLYEAKKCITYPRTDSKYLSTDMISKVKNTLKTLPGEYQTLTEEIEGGIEQIKISKRVFDNEKLSDHHAIIPTPQKVNTQALSKDELSIYDMVVRRFIAAFCRPYIYDSTKVISEVGRHLFKSYGKQVKQLGFTKVLKESKAKKAKDEKDEKLPDLKLSEERKVHSVKQKKEMTKAPSHHSDASLLSAMENAGKEIEDEELKELMKGSGLGTPATRAAIIDRIIKVGYVSRQGKNLIATDKGEKLISAVPEEIASSEMTGKWEKALNEIAKNNMDVEKFDKSIRKFSAYLVEYAKNHKQELQFEETKYGKAKKKTLFIEDAVCPLCKGRVLENSKAFACEHWQEGCKLTVWKNCFISVGGPMLNAKIISILLSKGEVSGTSGRILLKDQTIAFIKKGEENPVKSTSIVYSR